MVFFVVRRFFLNSRKRYSSPVQRKEYPLLYAVFNLRLLRRQLDILRDGIVIGLIRLDIAAVVPRAHDLKALFVGSHLEERFLHALRVVVGKAGVDRNRVVGDVAVGELRDGEQAVQIIRIAVLIQHGAGEHEARASNTKQAST